MTEARTRSSGGDTLDREERLRQLGRVTGELLHDLGGLLSVLAGRVSLAREEAALGRIPTDELSRIQSDTEEVRRMVLEILDELRGFRPSLEVTFPVGATLEEVVNRWLMGAPLVTTTLTSSLKHDVQISGPRSFFSRAIGNLLRNAARHTRTQVRLSLRLIGHLVEIRVEDDGGGVPADLRDRLFDPFVTGASLGVGLGLSFARWGVERLGGTLTLEPESSGLGGAAFRVTLPVAAVTRRSISQSTAARTTRAATTTRPPLAGLTVAIVDDDGAVRQTFARLLRRSGAAALEMDPLSWSSAFQAVETIRAEMPDIVLLDLNLRTLSVEEMYSLLKAQAQDLAERVVFFTGGPAPQQGIERPVLNKMLAWDDFVSCMLGAVRPRE